MTPEARGQGAWRRVGEEAQVDQPGSPPAPRETLMAYGIVLAAVIAVALFVLGVSRGDDCKSMPWACENGHFSYERYRDGPPELHCSGRWRYRMSTGFYCPP